MQTLAVCPVAGWDPVILSDGKFVCRWTVGMVCGGGDTPSTSSLFWLVVWLLNWSDRLEGRSRQSFLHTVYVFTLLSFNLWEHVTHVLCVFCVAHAFQFVTTLCLLLCRPMNSQLCYTYKQSGLHQTSNPHKNTLLVDRVWNKEICRSDKLMLSTF